MSKAKEILDKIKIIEDDANRLANDVVNYVNKKTKNDFESFEFFTWEEGHGSPSFEKAVAQVIKDEYGLSPNIQYKMDGSAIAEALIAVARKDKKEIEKWKKEFKNNLSYWVVD